MDSMFYVDGISEGTSPGFLMFIPPRETLHLPYVVIFSCFWLIIALVTVAVLIKPPRILCGDNVIGRNVIRHQWTPQAGWR